MIYLDANALSSLRPAAQRVFERVARGEIMLNNPSAVHGLGRNARAALSRARKQILQFLLGDAVTDAQLYFTSGGTEGCNALIFGFVDEQNLARTHIVCSAIEHPALLEAVKQCEENGAQVDWVKPDQSGIISSKSIVEAIRPETQLVALMAANNETGALQPVLEVASKLRASGYRGALVSDISQAIAKTDLSVSELFVAGVDTVCMSGHKLGAPSGIGAVVFAPASLQTERCLSFSPQLLGGPQESRFRAGTENLLGAIALGEVAAELRENLEQEIKSKAKLRNFFWASLSEQLSGIELLSPQKPSECLSNTLLVRFDGCRGDDLVVAFDLAGIATSTGSACASGKQGTSHVLLAMGRDLEAARQTIRFSLDWNIDEVTLAKAVRIITKVVNTMREGVETSSSESAQFI